MFAKSGKRVIFIVIGMLPLVFASCVKSQKTIAKQNFQVILSSFIGKTPNQLYATLGKPDEYKVVLDKKKKIIHALANYKYIFDFKTRTYDCVISFITDKTQQTIKDYAYNSEKCFYITMY